MPSAGWFPQPQQDRPHEYGAVGLHRRCWPPSLLVLAQLPLGGLWGTEGDQANGFSDGSPLTEALYWKGHPASSHNASGGERIRDASRKENSWEQPATMRITCAASSQFPKGPVERTGQDQARQVILASFIQPWGGWVCCFKENKEVDVISPARLISWRIYYHRCNKCGLLVAHNWC